MHRNRRIAVWLFFLIPLVLLLVVALFFDPWPARDGMDAARTHARNQGYNALDGGSADFVAQPDEWGGCEVEAQVYCLPQNVVVRVRRSWLWGSWRLVSIRTMPVSP